MQLEPLFSKTSRQAFFSGFFGRAPFVQTNCAARLIGFFNWRTLDRVLRQEESQGRMKSEVLVVKRGEPLPGTPPTSLPEARCVLDSGASIVVRHAEERDTGLALLAGRFAEEMRGETQVQLFVTPRGERGFGWLYGADDLFVVQTVGTNEYLFRANTVDPRPTPGRRYDFSRALAERTPVMGCTLAPGDWLYLPKGWWHTATALDDSLGISLGVLR